MITDENKLKSLRLALSSLPEGVKNWIASEQATYLQVEINKRLGLKPEQEKIVNQLSARLLTQDLNPRDFISELSHELNISFTTAKVFAQEIEEKIFRPIENELRQDVGLDIKLIYFDQPIIERKPFEQTASFSTPVPFFAPAPNIIPNTPITPPQETSGINIKQVELPKIKDLSSWAKPSESILKPSEQKTTSEQKTNPLTPKPKIGTGTKIDLQKFQIKDSEIPETPFMIHKEETAAQTIKPEAPMEKTTLNIKSLGSNFEKLIPQKPVSARLETQGFNQNSSQKEPVRTVHYSNFRTPLENAEKTKQQNTFNRQLTSKTDNNIIDLRKIQK